MKETLSLLYVDDDPDIIMIVQLALGLDPAIEMRTATSGAEALRILIDGGWRPDVVVLDVMMPGMGGVEMLDILRGHAPLRDLPVVFMTAKGRDNDLARYTAAGAKGIIVKPFDPLRLAVELRETLGR